MKAAPRQWGPSRDSGVAHFVKHVLQAEKKKQKPDPIHVWMTEHVYSHCGLSGICTVCVVKQENNLVIRPIYEFMTTQHQQRDIKGSQGLAEAGLLLFFPLKGPILF